MGLRTEDEAFLKKLSGRNFRFQTFGEKAVPGATDLEKANPLVIWMPLKVWTSMSKTEQRVFQNHDAIHRVLVLEPGDNMEDLEQAMGVGFMEILRSPIESRPVQKVLDRALDARDLYRDIYHMTQEIYLERELLTRKNEHLSFINRFLSRTAESLDASEILIHAREDLDMLFPVSLLQAAMWRKNSSGSTEAVFYLDQLDDLELRNSWLEFMTGSVNKLTGEHLGTYHTVELPPPNGPKIEAELHPIQGRVVIMPLRSGENTFGCIVLLSEEQFNLGRDQVELLHSAVKHLSLALRNARLFDEVRIKAQFDGLTKLHNRGHFDNRLEEEYARHQRYGHDLSILLIDLDHFKDINDTYGHAAGDLVLQELGRLLSQKLRSSDYAARFGGEEFAILLPQTNENQAWIMAERLRQQIAKHLFVYDGQALKVTASMGIASIRSGFMENRGALLRSADEALYQAKANGRNMVMLTTPKDNGRAFLQA